MLDEFRQPRWAKGAGSRDRNGFLGITAGAGFKSSSLLESRRRPDVASGHISVRWGVVGAGDHFARTIHLWCIP